MTKPNKDVKVLKPGDRVKIRVYNENQSAWDITGKMMGFMGKDFIVSERSGLDNYHLSGLRWSWRRRDLILLDSADNCHHDPNFSFRMRKCKRLSV